MMYFFHNAITSLYVCNSDPIDGTDIIRIIASVSGELRFLLDFKLLKNRTTLNQGKYGLCEYTQNVLNNSQFATSIIHILVKELQTAHR